MTTHALLSRAACATLVLAAFVACSSGPSPGSNLGSTAGALSPSSGWTGCSGTFDAHASPTGAYFVTDFGCSSSPAFTDSADNCCPSGVVQAAAAGLCKSGVTTAGCTSDVGTSSAIACERAVNWFSTGGTAFGLGTRLRLTRPDTGASVVVFVIDNGPACSREEQFGGYALDISYPAIKALYGEEEGVSDRAVVQVTVVPSSTALGVATASGPIGGDAGHDAEKEAGTLTPGVDAATVVDAARTIDASDGGVVSSNDAGTDASAHGPACSSDGDCNPGADGAGQYCDSGFCVDGCDADWECPGNTSCVSGACQ